MTDKPCIENATYDELPPGRSASLTRTLTGDEIARFAAVSGDVNPAHMNATYAQHDMFHGVVGHGMWLGGLISAVLGNTLPGAGTIYLEQDIKFHKPVRPGDTVTVTITVRDKPADKKPRVIFDCRAENQKHETVADGIAVVLAPVEKIKTPETETPALEIQTHGRYQALMEACRGLPPMRTAVVHPVQPEIIEAVNDAVKDELIIPVLVGPRPRIMAAAAEAKIDISAWDIVDTPHSHASGFKGAGLAAKGDVQAIMKGSLHTDELLGPIVAADSGLRTERRLSHVYIMDVPAYHKLLFITDAVVNIAPDLNAKADICRNAIECWRALESCKTMPENRAPKLAILAAVEVINPKMPATLDAAALCKMAERGQIAGGIIDGPLALDNAVSKIAAAEKGIVSDVAGDADILVVPEIEAGNMLAKELTFLGQADAAGIVLGARVPVILTSRADNLRTRLSSCAVAVLLAEARRRNEAGGKAT
ncbi:MAG: bifunctional enoyl-CoA hydratase/phosphate acetyltransferase [Alphaproteobacteria bacterium]|nr:bifunctional enoyl-CoA hydratase/phosphate acetyltransferase [Alphaproteobacteria bacterium]